MAEQGGVNDANGNPTGLTQTIENIGQDVVLTIRGQGKIPDFTNWVHKTDSTRSLNMIEKRSSGQVNIADKIQSNYKSRAPWGDGLADTPNHAMITKIVVESGITGIGGCAFWGGVALKEVELADTVETIDQCAFAQCEELEQCNHPEKCIDWYAFQNCGKYSSGLIAENLETLEVAAFQGCSTNMGEVKLPKIKTIDSAFSASTKISSLQLGNSLVNIKTFAFQNVTIDSDVYIPQGTVESQAFDGCTINGQLKIGGNVVLTGEDPDISSSASPGSFYRVTVKQGVIFEEGIRTISPRCFEDASIIGNIIIPSSVTRIGSNAFYLGNSKNSSKIYCYADPNTLQMSTTNNNIFYSSANGALTVQVLHGHWTTYNSKWTKYTFTELTALPLKVYYKDSDGYWKQGIMWYKDSTGWQKGTKVYIKRNKESSTTGETIWVGKTS